MEGTSVFTLKVNVAGSSSFRTKDEKRLTEGNNHDSVVEFYSAFFHRFLFFYVIQLIYLRKFTVKTLPEKE